jgi:phenylacetate-CoA ligase
MNFRGMLLKHAVLPAADFFTGHGIMRRLAYLQKAQWLNREQTFEQRDRLLRELIMVAYREVPFYRELMQGEGVRPEDIRTAADLKKLPPVTKDMLRAAYPQKTVRATGQKTREARTSGSTGQNFIVREDSETAGRYRAAFFLAASWSGWEFGMPYVQTGMTLNRQGMRGWKDLLFQSHYVSAYDLTDAHLDLCLDYMETRGIRYLWGYPGSLFCLAKRARQRGWNRPLESLLTWGDNLSAGYRREIEASFKARIYDTYGCAEGMQIAAQCPSGTYHVHNLDVIVEYEGKSAAGQPQALLVTRLHPGPMPFVRYRIGDLGIQGAKPCSCGRGWETVESIAGRDTDIILTPAGNRLIVHFFTGILEHFKEVESFQAVQQDPSQLTLRVVSAEPSEELASRIKSALSEKGAADLRIEIEWVREIPLSAAGKRRFVVSEFTKKEDSVGL